jgi:hypothetical protein
VLILCVNTGATGATDGATHGSSAAPDSDAVATAVGRLRIPAIRYENGYARHYDEQCSATVVAIEAGMRSPYLLSAWHCLEDYRDLSRPLIFTDAHGAQYTVQVLTSGGGMHSDWALLRTANSLPGALPLGADTGSDTSPVHLAGHPRATAADAFTLLRDCSVSGTDGRDLRTDCVLQRGASGGAAVRGVGGLRLVGVISRGDGVSQSIFVPVARFLGDIRRYLLEDS